MYISVREQYEANNSNGIVNVAFEQFSRVLLCCATRHDCNSTIPFNKLIEKMTQRYRISVTLVLAVYS